MGDFRFQSTTLEALQESTEYYLTQIFEDAFRCTVHRDRVTLMPKDVQLVKSIRNDLD